MEPTLNAQYNDLVGDVGAFLGYGRGAAFSTSTLTLPTWDGYQQQNIDRCVKGGMRRFYFCGYDWSFLKPMTNLAINANSYTMPLPDDYGGFEGEACISAPVGYTWWQFKITGVGEVHAEINRWPTRTGRPLMGCVEPLKGTGPTQSNRFQLRIFPLPDQQYTLQFQYYINPDYLTGAFPYAYGGPPHAETLLAACKAVAELELDDLKDGPQNQSFDELMEMSKKLDRRNKAQWIGYNRDHSDLRNRHWRGPNRQWNDTAITIQGQVY